MGGSSYRTIKIIFALCRRKHFYASSTAVEYKKSKIDTKRASKRPIAMRNTVKTTQGGRERESQGVEKAHRNNYKMLLCCNVKWNKASRFAWGDQRECIVFKPGISDSLWCWANLIGFFSHGSHFNVQFALWSILHYTDGCKVAYIHFPNRTVRPYNLWLIFILFFAILLSPWHRMFSAFLDYNSTPITDSPVYEPKMHEGCHFFGWLSFLPSLFAYNSNFGLLFDSFMHVLFTLI